MRNSQSIAVTQFHLDTRKTETLWLVMWKSRASALDFDAKVVSTMEVETSVCDTGSKKDGHMRLTDRKITS